MLLGAVSVLFLALSVVVFFWTLRRGIYRRKPYEHFLLVGGAVILGVLAAVQNPGLLIVSLAALEGLAFVALVWYMGIGARFSRGELSVQVGDLFPSAVLTDSEGTPFDTRSLTGKTTALYLFYRGDW